MRVIPLTFNPSPPGGEETTLDNMKSAIIYFSQTGNTRKVAGAIRDAIGAESGSCDIFRLQDVNIKDLAGYDLIGLGCPCFVLEEPLNVKRFIRKLGVLRRKHFFVFATHGGHPGDVLSGMAGKLRRQGIKVIGGFNCDGSDHMPHYTNPWFTEGHPDEIDLKAAYLFGEEVARRYQEIASGGKVTFPKFTLLRKGPYRDFVKHRKVNKARSRGFEINMTLDTKKCKYPKCRLCIDNCPVKAIDLSTKPITFRKGCISCYFCEMVCPTGAIEADEGTVKAKRESTVKRLNARSYPEFFKRAKKELLDNRYTLYRMLVDKVEIGNTEGMYGESHLKRPRFIIRKGK